MPSKTYQIGDQALVRRINLSVILQELRNHAPLSRAALAERTGLNKTTVSSLVNELIEQQFVRELGLEMAGSKGGVGRLAMLLTLDPAAGYIISGEIGVDFISAICANFAPEVIWHHREDIQPDMGQDVIIHRMLALFDQAASFGAVSCKSLLGITLGVPGLVDQESGSLMFAPNLKWENVPLRSMLSEHCSAPVFVNNEANMAALGEHHFGAAQGYEDVLYISAGIGLGGGFVHRGRLFSGATGVAAEFGHMTMDPAGELCSCGNYGCWETQVSQSALFRLIQRQIQSGKISILRDASLGNLDHLTLPRVLQAARQGDTVTLACLEQVGRSLGIGIASLVNALNPEMVVLGGALSQAGEFLLPVVQEELERRALKWSREASRVVLAQHGANACLMGGVAMVYDSILTQPLINNPQMIPAG